MTEILRLLAYDCTFAEHVRSKCKFETLIEVLNVARGEAQSQAAKDVYDDIIASLTDCNTNLNVLVRDAIEATHGNSSHEALGASCVRKAMEKVDV